MVREQKGTGPTSFRVFSLDVRPVQLRISVSTPGGTREEKKTCADLYSGEYLKSSIRPRTLVSLAEMKYTPERVGSGSRRLVTISTTAQGSGSAADFQMSKVGSQTQ